MANNSTKKVTSTTDLGTMHQAAFADAAAVVRVSESGLDWHPLGDISTAQQCGAHTPVLVYNSTGAAIFVAFGAQTMAAPSAATNGVPVLAGQVFVLNSGANAWVRASAALVFGYNADLL